MQHYNIETTNEEDISISDDNKFGEPNITIYARNEYGFYMYLGVTLSLYELKEFHEKIGKYINEVESKENE